MIIVGVQARLGSSRLPRKVLMDVDGMPMVLKIYKRLEACNNVDAIYFLVPSHDFDLRDFLYKHRIPFQTGDEDDVLSRYYNLSKGYKDDDIIVRITGDCPFVMPDLVDRMSKNAYLSQMFITNVSPRFYPKGMDVECIPVGMLRRMNKVAISADEREHVTKVLYKPESVRGVNFSPSIFSSDELSYSEINLSVDIKEDLNRVNAIYDAFPEKALLTYKEVIDCIKERRDLFI